MADVKNRTLASTLFHLLPDDTWESLRARMTERRFAPGEIIVEQGTLEPDFHVVVEGIASVVARSGAGEPRELGRLGFGECVGEMSLLTGEPASARVLAVGDVKTYAASHTQLANLGELRAELIEALSAILAGRLKHANERLLAQHPANVHLVCCDERGAAAIAGLAPALASITGGRVLLLGAGDRVLAAAAPSPFSDTVRAERIEPHAHLPALLERVAHEHGEIVVIGDEEAFHQIAPDAASMLHVMHTDAPGVQAEGHASPGHVVAVSSDPWTPPSLRRLSQRYRRPVVGVVPPGGDDNATARLARVMLNRQIGVALGAGAAKGMAHLGVLRALKELAIPIDVIGGCSIGSAIAAGHAGGMSLDELTSIVTRAASRAVRPTLPVRSFLSNGGIKDELKRLAGDRRIEDLDLPLAVVATDIFRRTAVTFTSGLLWPRLLASMAIPGVYPPTAANGSFLVDGGVLSPVPVQQCRALGAGIVVGVRLTATRTSPRESLDYTPSMPLAMETMMRTFEIMLNRISEVSHEHADVNIEICIEGTGGIRDFRRGNEIAALGYEATMAAAQDLRSAIPQSAAVAS